MNTLVARRQEKGQTMAEYSIILAVITAAIVLGYSQFSAAILSLFNAFVAIIP